MQSLNDLLAAGQTNKARAAAEMRLYANAKDTDALSALAKLDLVAGNVTRAEQYIERLEAEGATSETALMRANAAARRGELEEAERLFRSAIESGAQAEAHFGLGLILLKREEAEGALAEFEEALRLKPGFGIYEFHVAHALGVLEREPDRILALLASAIGHAPGYAPSYVFLARINSELGRAKEGTALLKKAVALMPNDAALLSSLTNAALLSGELTTAYESALKLATTYEDDPVALANLALLVLTQEQWDLALQICTEAEERGVTTAALKRIEATALLGQTPPDYVSAAAAYEAASELEPEDWRAPNDYGLMLLRWNDSGENLVPDALELLEEASARAPEEPTPKLNLALACLRSGDPARAAQLAREILASSMRLDPSVRDQAERLLQSLRN